ncbi:g3548 [Coccomyxa viridis]|uniref:G3548 protein n=1 Tax=Coccomyxa viridis TaxID=1274662 RepID=A0ABP1FT79_9CHLO
MPANAEDRAAGAMELERRLEERISEFELPNGLHFIVMERHNAPIVSVHTYADVGAFDERDGQTGIAHLLEHMAFKGSQRIGAREYKKEAVLLEAVDDAFYAFWDAHTRSASSSGRLYEQLQQLVAQAEELVEPNAFGAMLQKSGAVGLNATTSHDATKYFMSLPANMLELWFALEAERFQAPVFRELYSEKKVVAEERRSRIDNSPMGRFQETFLSSAISNNYRRPIIGYEQDVAGLGRREVEAFFRERYGPKNLAITIVGDTTPEKVRAMAEKYFGAWRQDAIPALPPSSSEVLAQPPSGVERRLDSSARGGPTLMQAYYRPGIASVDAPILEVIGDIMTGSRTARFNRSLLQEGKAFGANLVPAYPGDKHACTSLIYAIPATGVSLAQMEGLVRQQLDSLADKGPTASEMERIKKASKVELVDALRRNSGMAAALASYHTLTGSWRTILQESAQIETLKAADVRDVAARTFTPENCFTGYVRKA